MITMNSAAALIWAFIICLFLVYYMIKLFFYIILFLIRKFIFPIEHNKKIDKSKLNDVCYPKIKMPHESDICKIKVKKQTEVQLEQNQDKS